MAEICYVSKKFNADHEAIIENANAICSYYYHELGIVITLRQLHYQFVSRNLYANTQANYNKLGNVVTDSRLAGRLDWSYLIDRTRNEVKRTRWENVGKLLTGAADGYHMDLWKGQGVRPMVLVEKDAAIGVIESVCHANDIPYLSCRGYMSWSELWNMAQRIRYDIENGDNVVILHIGDHDPSGLDMTRDIEDRLWKVLWKDWSLTHARAAFTGPITVGMLRSHMLSYMTDKRDELGVTAPIYHHPWRVKRIALNYDQVERYSPPPNPARTTDARYARYVEETGLDESWELDALDPPVLINLIQDEIDLIRDEERWDAAVEKQERDRINLTGIAKHYQPVMKLVSDLDAGGSK